MNKQRQEQKVVSDSLPIPAVRLVFNNQFLFTINNFFFPVLTYINSFRSRADM